MDATKAPLRKMDAENPDQITHFFELKGTESWMWLAHIEVINALGKDHLHNNKSGLVTMIPRAVARFF